MSRAAARRRPRKLRRQVRTAADVEVVHVELMDPRTCCIRCYEPFEVPGRIYCDRCAEKNTVTSAAPEPMPEPPLRNENPSRHFVTRASDRPLRNDKSTVPLYEHNGRMVPLREVPGSWPWLADRTGHRDPMRCVMCGAELPKRDRGRTRHYCSNACRQKAHRMTNM